MSDYIEAHLILAKGQNAKALEHVIDTVLSHPNIYVFGEFLALPVCKELNPKMLATLELFAYGTYPEYKASPNQFVSLKPQQEHKLKLVTLAQMASNSSQCNYTDLMQATNISEIRALEDAVIDCFQVGLLKGRLDQKNRKLHV